MVAEGEENKTKKKAIIEATRKGSRGISVDGSKSHSSPFLPFFFSLSPLSCLDAAFLC